MTKVMTVGNGKMWKTGYGNQMALYLPRLKASGYDPVEFAFTDGVGAPVYRDDILTVMRRYDTWGNDAYSAHMNWTQADLSIGLFDFYCADTAEYHKHNHVQIAAVDAEPLRKDLAKALREGARWVWAMSRFGERVLKEAGFNPTYVPHSVDTKVYKPIDRAEARRIVQAHINADEPERQYGVELGDKFVVLMCAANIDERKGFWEGLRAWQEFHKRHPDSVLYLHTDMAGVRGDNLFDHFDAMGINPDGCIVWPNQYFYHMGMLSGENMNDVYNTADVLLHPSHGEGFGIPILESQSAGTPVIVTDYSAMTELCLSGIKVPGEIYPRRPGLFWKRPNIDALVDALEVMYTARIGNSPPMVAAKVAHYDADIVFAEYMLPAIQAIEAELEADKAALGPEHPHKWAHVGLRVNGQFMAPCLIGKCEAGRMQDGVIVQHAYPAKIGDIELDIEDDPEAGVSKVVLWEIKNTYHLDMVDLRPGDVAVDIGAHVGVVSCYLAARFPDARIEAYEPNDTNYRHLLANVARNLLHDKIQVNKMAVTGDGRHIQMPVNIGINSGGNNIYNNDLLLVNTVPSCHIKAILDTYNPVLLKVDCEGAEYEIFEGKATFLKGVRYLIGEFHTNNRWPKERAEALLTDIRRIVPNVWVTLCPVDDLPEETAGSNGHKPVVAEAVTA